MVGWWNQSCSHCVINLTQFNSIYFCINFCFSFNSILFWTNFYRDRINPNSMCWHSLGWNPDYWWRSVFKNLVDVLDEYTCMKDLALKENENIAVHTQTGTLGYLFLGKIMQMPVCSWTFLLKIGAPNHHGKGLDPPPP